ncbi:MAG: hypothetical protein JWO67_298 [Streptosporangiaceae bacterium]|nr:hypothetical protein [Streptosporangiaceae bacterium]
MASEDEELERQIHEHYGTWRDSPPGRLGCLIVIAFVLLTTGAVVLGAVLLLR